MACEERLREFHDRGREEDEQSANAKSLVAPPCDWSQETEDKEPNQFCDHIRIEDERRKSLLEGPREWNELKSQSEGCQQEPQASDKRAEHWDGYGRHARTSSVGRSVAARLPLLACRRLRHREHVL